MVLKVFGGGRKWGVFMRFGVAGFGKSGWGEWKKTWDGAPKRFACVLAHRPVYAFAIRLCFCNHVRRQEYGLSLPVQRLHLGEQGEMHLLYQGRLAYPASAINNQELAILAA